jgi:hypothetical protein
MEFLGAIDLALLALLIGILFVGASALVGGAIFYVMRSREKTPPRRPQASPRSTSNGEPSAASEKVAKEPEKPDVERSLRKLFAGSSEVGRPDSTAPAEVLRLLRDRVTGALIVEVEKEKFHKLSEIEDGRVGRQVLQAAADLVRFTEVLQPRREPRTRQPTSPTPSTLASKVAPSLEDEPPAPRTPAPPSVEQEFLQSLAQREGVKEKESKTPSLSPIEFFRRGFAARRAARLQSDTPVLRSFVDEIEEILQRFMRTYPSFIGKEVHVGTGPGGGIRIQVENEYYDTPDDIPDPEIRGIIKAAIKEWEKS